MLSKEIDGDTLRFTDKMVYIIGPLKLQNEMMASLIEEETKIPCHIVEGVGKIPDLDDVKSGQQRLILWDCLGKDPDVCFAELEQFERKVLDRTFIAFFNVSPNIQFAEEAVARGVRGFFYEQDPFEKLPKGVRAILEGELWVSRKILTTFFMENRRGNQISTGKKSLLTSREIEIMALISIGAKNEEIAEQLFISPNTVKTHIYNIFKKINVPNRLQAALWAAKHL